MTKKKGYYFVPTVIGFRLKEKEWEGCRVCRVGLGCTYCPQLKALKGAQRKIVKH